MAESKCVCPSGLFHERSCRLVHGEPLPPLVITWADTRPIAMPTTDGRIFVEGCDRSMVLDPAVAVTLGMRLLDLGWRAADDLEILRG